MELSEALIRYQYDEAPNLSFNLLPDRLVNEKYCHDLSELILCKSKGNWEKLKATKNLYRSIPDLPGLYLFIWKLYFPFKFDNSKLFFRYILYIGKAGGSDCKGTLRSRYQSEYSKIIHSDPEKIWVNVDMNTRIDRLQKLLNLHDLEYWFLPLNNCNDMSVIEILEDRLIKLFNPPGNRRGTRVKYGETESAF